MNSARNPEFDAEIVAFRALAWTVADEARADRLLALTGMTASRLRDGLNDRRVLAAVIDFLANHEADLIACSDAIGIEPMQIIAARDSLAR